MDKETNGVFWAVSAYILWGIMPIYWKSIAYVDSFEILINRIVWAFFSTLLLVFILRQGKELKEDIQTLWKSQKEFWLLFIAAVLVSGNWGLYIWAVNNDYLVQTSLGYYINPLVSVLLGILFLKEKLSRAQQIAFLLATIGVIILTFSYGKFPWLAFVLAISFALYGLIKKQIQLDAIRGMAIETFFIMPFALTYFIWLFMKNDVAFLHIDVKTDVLLILTGAATAAPLILFTKGAQKMPLYMVGFLQYIAPSLMLFLGVIVYKETFGKIDFISFAFIWIALILFTFSKVSEAIKAKKQVQEGIIEKL